MYCWQRATQQVNGAKAETAIFYLYCLLNSGMCGYRFRIAHLNRSTAFAKNV